MNMDKTNQKKSKTASGKGIGGSNFLVSVQHTENHSWQGYIQWLDTGRKIHFRSELEMLTLMQEAVQRSQPSETPFRSWDDDQRIYMMK
ncbi:MAG: hypothetical protein PWQ12_742 [Clostridiales bacterium]|jgi:alpha-D-ribose 1-methylphosphonate 5-triphosphate synthase subunit PhnI|nr:hypothetical protein [Clostridiales bacterium]